MGRTKKLNSKISKNSKNSKSKRANKKKNVRISKKKVGGSDKTPGRFSKPREGRRLPQTNLFGRSAGKKTGFKAEGFFEKIERTAKERAGNALRELLKVVIEYKTNPDAGGLWINFLRSLRFKHIPGEIMLDYKILEHFRKLVLSNPQYEDIKQFLVGSAQTGDHIDFTDMGYMKDGKAFPTWLLEMILNPQIQFKPFSIYSISPV